MTDDRRIPPAALALGLAGLIPFLWSAATHLSTPMAGWAGGFLPPMFIGAYVGLTYGTVILAFMSGALWGFAARSEAGALPYALSTIPALWVFFMVSDALLATNRFVSPLPMSQVWVLGTYYAAQVLIVMGMLRGRRSGAEPAASAVSSAVRAC